MQQFQIKISVLSQIDVLNLELLAEVGSQKLIPCKNYFNSDFKNHNGNELAEK